MKEFLRIYINSYRGLSRPAWMLALVIFINRSGAMVLPFLGVYMTQHLQFSIKDAGVVLSCFGLGAIIGSWLGGWLTDKIGHFKVQLSSLFLCVPLFLILPQFTHVVSLAIAIFVLSVVSETFRPANSVSVAYYAKPENVTRAFSLNRMAVNLGFSIGPALGGLLAAVSYSLLFYGNGFSVLIAGLLFFFYFRNRKGYSKTNVHAKSADATALKRSPYRDGVFIVFNLLVCLYAVCFFQILNTLPIFYREVHKMSEASIGIILAFSGLIVFLLEMLLVQFAERSMADRTVIILGTLLCGLSYILLNAPGGQPLLYLSIFILCISEILAMPFMATVTVRRAGNENQGAYMGMNALAFSAAHILSPYIGTRIASDFGFGVLWWGTGIVSALTAAGFYFVFKRL